MNRHSLRWKLLPLVLFLQLSLMAAMSYMATDGIASLAREQTGTRVKGLGVELQAALIAPMLERDYPTLNEIATDLLAVGDLDYIVVFDLAGKEMARAGLLQTATVPLPDSSLATSKDVLNVRIPMSQGHVMLGLKITEISTILSRYGVKAISLTLVSGLLAGLVMTLITLWITRRLTGLEQVTQEFGQGNHTARVPPDHHRDEISRLGEAFNRMAVDIEQRVGASIRAEAEAHAALLETGEEHARLDALLANLKIGILFIGRDEKVLYTNPALRRIWLIPPKAVLVGLPADRALVSSANVLSQPDHFSRLVLRTPGTQEISDSTELEMNDGRVITQLCHPVRDRHDRLVGRLWVFEDVTQERHSAEQLIYLAERDGLTGLLNRRRFEGALESTLGDAGRRRNSLALLFFDLDDFKHLNDHFGHRAGDAALTRVANEISSVVRKNEVLARLGGDEFAVLVPEISTIEEAQGLAERIVRAVARLPLSFDGHNLRMTASLGIAIYPDHATNQADLVMRADMAMYQAKASGKNCWRLFDSASDSVSLERLTWNERIQNALDQNLLEMHYQGIHGTDGSLQHLEALMRMKNVDVPGTLISPNNFIPLAEKTGKIMDLDRWAVAAVINELATHPDLPDIAVNISARSLADVSFPRYILDTLESKAVAPRRLLLELTETAAMGDLQDARRFLETLQPAGCRVCLDDFGTGFASFAYLKHIKADVLKIDGQFILGLVNDKGNQSVVRAIVDVARGMGISTIAECVEDADTLALLSGFGIDAAQGYHLSLPHADASSHGAGR